MNAVAERFWQEYARAAALPVATAHRVYCIGDEPALCRRVLDLIRAGEKTGTFGLQRDFERAAHPLPQADEHLVLTEFDGRPDLIVRLDAVRVLRFDAVGDADAACEGPGLRAVEPWRQVHWAYWQRKLAAHGEVPTLEMPVVCQRFTLAHLAARP